MPKFRLDRRSFLGGLAACFLLPTAIPAKAAGATEVFPDVWRTLEQNPVTFVVDQDRRIKHTAIVPPITRADAFDLSYADVVTPGALLDTADAIQPLMWALWSEYTDFRDGLPKVDQERWPEAPEEGVERWVRGLNPLAFADLRSTVHQWLDSEPDYMNEEDEFFTIPASAQDYAFRFFKDHFPGDPEAILGVIVVEGGRSGSNYYAAELTMSVADANRRAEANGIPIRFTGETI